MENEVKVLTLPVDYALYRSDNLPYGPGYRGCGLLCDRAALEYMGKYTFTELAEGIDTPDAYTVALTYKGSLLYTADKPQWDVDYLRALTRAAAWAFAKVETLEALAEDNDTELRVLREALVDNECDHMHSMEQSDPYRDEDIF